VVVTKLVAARHLGGLDKKAVTAAIGQIDPAGRKGAISYNQFKDWFTKARAKAKASFDEGISLLSPILFYMDHPHTENEWERRMTVRPRLHIGQRRAGPGGARRLRGLRRGRLRRDSPRAVKSFACRPLYFTWIVGTLMRRERPAGA
jgi:hypothetical protein